jgi:hypothetical protein
LLAIRSPGFDNPVEFPISYAAEHNEGLRMANRIALNGRVATQADVDAGAVIFYIPDGRSVPYQFGRDLPLKARIVGEESECFPKGTEIEIFQAEVGDTGDVLIGFLAGEDEGVCMLHEIGLID